MEPKTGKKFVSQGEYVANLRKKAGISIWGILLLFLCLAGLLFTRVLLFDLLQSPSLGMLWCAGEMAGYSLYAGYLGNRNIQEAKQIDPGVPRTRYFVASVSEAGTLVRASEEPRQAQDAVLLRAVAQGQEKHEEQLLRATIGGQEQP